MSDITIKEFSKTVGLSVNRLIDQLELAGVKKKNESDLISDEEKMQLLNYVRSSQSKKKKITPKQIKENDIKQNDKTNTVIRKKRVFSKVNNQVTEKVEVKPNNENLKKDNVAEEDTLKEDVTNNIENIEKSVHEAEVVQSNVESNDDVSKKRRKKSKTKFVNEEKNNPSIKSKQRRQKIHISDDNRVVRKKPQKKAFVP